jgi:hypothetical protein
MSLSLDEVTFLEQQIELLKSCSVQEALQLATERLQKLKSNLHSVSFDPKVRACHRVAVESTSAASGFFEHPSGFR